MEDDSHARVQDEEEDPEGQDCHVHYPDHDGADHEQDHVDKEEKPNVSPNILFLLTLIPWIFRQAKIRKAIKKKKLRNFGHMPNHR